MSTNLPSRVTIHEVVLRDGIQNEAKLVPPEVKLSLVHRLIESGIKRIEVSSFVNPRLVPQMADAEDLWRRLPREEDVTFSALILGRKSLERAVHCGVPHVGIFVSASETHSRKNSNRSVAEAVPEALSLIERAKSHNIKVRAGVMNAFGCAYEGAVPPEKVMQIVERFMMMDPDEICLADTSGMANPLQIQTVVRILKTIVKSTPVSLHLHNTRGLGLANLWEALREGVTIIDTSMGGLGGCPFIPGAKGNIATEDTIHLLHEVGIETGVDLAHLIRTSREFEDFMGKEFPVIISRLHDIPECDA